MFETSEEQNIENAKSHRDTLHVEKMASQVRCSELADEFTHLEVQVAAILVAFAGVFLKFFNSELIDLPSAAILIMKYTYAFSVFFLILSLVLGLIHLKRKEKFWDEALNIKHLSLKKWNAYLRREITYREAQAYMEGTARGRDGIIHSPFWTWILQTVFLGLAFVLFFILFIVLLAT